MDYYRLSKLTLSYKNTLDNYFYCSEDYFFLNRTQETWMAKKHLTLQFLGARSIHYHRYYFPFPQFYFFEAQYF